MLSMFVIKRTFYKLDVKLYVDCEKKEASITTKYDRILKDVDRPVTYADVDSPEKAEKWLLKPIPVKGGVQPMIEWLEAKYKAEAG